MLVVRKYQLENAKERGGSNPYLTLARLQARIDLYAGMCFYCIVEPATCIDHRIAVSRRPRDGSTNWPSNIVPACKSCSSKKWSHSPLHLFLKD